MAGTSCAVPHSSTYMQNREAQREQNKTETKQSNREKWFSVIFYGYCSIFGNKSFVLLMLQLAIAKQPKTESTIQNNNVGGGGATAQQIQTIWSNRTRCVCGHKFNYFVCVLACARAVRH